jgi:hypothetical protein
VGRGITGEFLGELRSTGLVWAGLGLGVFAPAGTWLTFGLIRPWGERFPRWVPGLAGKRVPIRLATVPATLVAIFVTPAVAFLATGNIVQAVDGELDGAALPMLLWPFWGVALGPAALAYHLRRRPACTDCGRGDPEQGVVSGQEAEAY